MLAAEEKLPPVGGDHRHDFIEPFAGARVEDGVVFEDEDVFQAVTLCILKGSELGETTTPGPRTCLPPIGKSGRSTIDGFEPGEVIGVGEVAIAQVFEQARATVVALKK